jgi:hypothetical protein
MDDPDIGLVFPGGLGGKVDLVLAEKGRMVVVSVGVETRKKTGL